MVIIQRKIVGVALQHSKRAPGRHMNDARHPLCFGGEEYVRRADEINCENIGGGPAAVAGDAGDMHDGVHAACRQRHRGGIEDVVAGVKIEAANLVTALQQPVFD